MLRTAPDRRDHAVAKGYVPVFAVPAVGCSRQLVSWIHLSRMAGAGRAGQCWLMLQIQRHMQCAGRSPVELALEVGHGLLALLASLRHEKVAMMFRLPHE